MYYLSFLGSGFWAGFSRVPWAMSQPGQNQGGGQGYDFIREALPPLPSLLGVNLLLCSYKTEVPAFLLAVN